MKKVTFALMVMVLSLTAFPALSWGNTNNPATSTSSLAPTGPNAPAEVPAEVQAMYDRLEEIKKMDKSEMSRSEKKELRKEVRAIKSELRSTGNGVYLSVGAIIIIILLLILLL